MCSGMVCAPSASTVWAGWRPARGDARSTSSQSSATSVSNIAPKMGNIIYSTSTATQEVRAPSVYADTD